MIFSFWHLLTSYRAIIESQHDSETLMRRQTWPFVLRMEKAARRIAKKQLNGIVLRYVASSQLRVCIPANDSFQLGRSRSERYWIGMDLQGEIPITSCVSVFFGFLASSLHLPHITRWNSHMHLLNYLTCCCLLLTRLANRYSQFLLTFR